MKGGRSTGLGWGRVRGNFKVCIMPSGPGLVFLLQGGMGRYAIVTLSPLNLPVAIYYLGGKTHCESV